MTYHNFDNIESVFYFNEPLLTSPNFFENDINDLFLNEEDNKRYYIHNDNNYQDTNIKPFMNTNNNFDNRTSDITDKRLKNLVKNENAPPFYSLNVIRGILIKNDDNNNRLFDKIIKDQRVLESEEYMKSGKKQSINNFNYQNDNIFNQENFNDFGYEEVKEKDNYLTKKR